MGAPSAVASKVASISLTGGKTIDLSGVKSQTAQQVYGELENTGTEVTIEGDNVVDSALTEAYLEANITTAVIIANAISAATAAMAKDQLYIQEILDQIRERLKELGYSEKKIDTIVDNMAVLTPSLIRICDYSEDLQSGKDVEQYKAAVKEAIIEFGVGEQHLLSKKIINQEAVIEVAEDMLSDLMTGKSFADIYEAQQKDVFDSTRNSAIKKLINNFIKKICKEYSDDVSKMICEKFLSRFGDDAIRFFGRFLSSDKTPFVAGMALDIFCGGVDDAWQVVQEGGKYSSNKYLNSLLEKIKLPNGTEIKGLLNGTASSLVPAAGCGQVPFLTKNLLSNVSQQGFKVQGRFARDVRSFLNSDSLTSKLFVPKEVLQSSNPSLAFAADLAKNTSMKAIACKAIGSGAASLVVGSIVSFAFAAGDVAHEAYVEARANGESVWDSTLTAAKALVVDGLEAGWEKVKEDFGKNCAAAVGTAVGQVAGSVAGAALGAAIGGPVGAYIGEKVGGFIGALVGGWIGETIYNAVTTETDHGDKCWYKPWTWF